MSERRAWLLLSSFVVTLGLAEAGNAVQAQPTPPKKSRPPVAKDAPEEPPAPVRPVIDLRPRPGQTPTPRPASDDARPHVTIDDDLARLYQEAESLAKQGEHALAAERYQQLLDAPRTSLAEGASDGTSLPRWTTWSTRAEQRLLQASAPLQSAYRLAAEGDARETAATFMDGDPSASEAALAEAAGRFLLTPAGLNATWTLSGRALDAFDFVVAARLLERFLAAAPPTDRRRATGLLRLAVACAYLGDRDAARDALDAEQVLADKPSASEAVERGTIRAFVTRLLDAPGVALVDDALAPTPSWLLSPRAIEPSGNTVVAEWRADFNREQLSDVAGRPARGEPGAARRIGAALRLADPRALDARYDDVLPRLDAASVGRRWLANPTYQNASLAPVNDGWFGVWTDRAATVLASPPSASSPREDASPRVAWSAPFGVPYAFPAAWKALSSARLNMRPQLSRVEAGDLPTVFDPVHGAVATNERQAFVVGPDHVEESPAVIRNAARATSLRARTNVLVAYDLDTGEEQWRANLRQRDAAEPLVDEGFVGAPTASATRVYAPRVERGVVAIVALDAETGESCWATRLCAEPRTGCWPWSSVTLARQGNDLYLATGAGAVFALDASTGAVRWGSEYPRAVERRRDLTLSMGGSTGTNAAGGATHAFDATLDGWDEDRTWTVGRALVVAASDSAELRTLDCRDGRTLWTTPRRLHDGRAASYVAGVTSRHVIVGGVDLLRAYELASGRLVWSADLPGKAGRATLTRDALLAPRIGTPLAADATAPTAVTTSAQAGTALVSVLNSETGAVLREVAVAVDRPTAPVTLAVTGDRVAWRDPWRLAELAPKVEVESTAAAARISPALPVPSGAPRPMSAPVPTSAPIPTSTSNPPMPTSGATPTNGASEAGRPAGGAGRILVSDLSGGKVIELSLDGQIVATRDGFLLPGPVCGFPDGRRFVYSHGDETLIEFDAMGQIRTRFDDLPGRPASLASLADGRLLLTFPDAGQLGALDPRSRTLRTQPCDGRPVDARRGEDGSTLVTLLADQRVIRLAPEEWPFPVDAAESARRAAGMVMCKRPGGVELAYPRSAQLRRDGGVVACLPRIGQVVRIDVPVGMAAPAKSEGGDLPPASATVIRAGLRGLQAALELPDGRLLVADQAGLTVWEAERVVWKQPDILVGGVSAW